MRHKRYDISRRMEDFRDYLVPRGRVLIAFSGGVDSTLLIHIAHDILNQGSSGDNVVALSLVTPLVHDFELNEAQESARRLRIRHLMIKYSTLNIREVREGAEDRCYHCKMTLFGLIKDKARELGIDYVLDGTNADDTLDYRPGMKALVEMGIRSPFLELGVGKDEIREISKKMGIMGYDRPPMACLATRFPYGEEITPEKLEMVKEAEVVLMEMGFKTFRVRYHGDIARIEVGRSELSKFLSPSFLNDVHDRIKEVGFSYITLDLKGYRSGSMNEGVIVQ